jgi:hydroxylaminobenzene mutase
MTVQSGGRHILIVGMALVLVGLLWGIVVPAATYPRLALGAHIQFVTNGMLLIIMATALLTLPHQVGPKSLAVMIPSVWLVWPMALSEAANGWWGTSQMLPIAAHEAGAAGGEPWQEMLLKLTHIIGGLGLIVAWMLLFIGFVRPHNAKES